MDRQNPSFVGRRDELRRLREMLTSGTVGVITAVHGLGGVGKTALANEYAHAFASEYPGGRWLLHCEGIEDLRVAFLAARHSARDRVFRSGESRLRISASGGSCASSRRERARPPDQTGTQPACLVLLDNLDQPALLSAAHGGLAARTAGGSTCSATTRLGPRDLARG